MKRLLTAAAIALLTTTAQAGNWGFDNYHQDPKGAELYGLIFTYHKKCAPLHYRILDAANAIGAPIGARDLAIAQNAALAAYQNDSAAFCERVKGRLNQ